MQARRLLFARVGDIGGKLGSKVDANLLDDWLSLGIRYYEAQLGSLNRREANDTAMTDGCQTVSVLHQFIFQRLPLSIHKSFERELLDPLSLRDILLGKETV